MNYLLFLDESGDHGLANIDPGFPVFVLCGVLISEASYKLVKERINEVKHRLWGNKTVIFHSRDIGKCEKEFQILFDLELKKLFYDEVNNIIRNSDYHIILSAIQKEFFIKKYGKLSNDVYEIALSFIIERAIFCLDDKENAKDLKVVIEKRGKKEDSKLKEHFQKLDGKGTYFIKPDRIKGYNTLIEFRDKKENIRDKKENINGLQLADLIAYPVARYVIDKNRANPAFDILASKIYQKGGKMYGLKIFP